MSISAGDWQPASDPEVSPPYEAPEVALSNWPDDVKRAWRTFRRVSEGDLVRWGDRSKPLEIIDRDVTDAGFVHLEVEGPRGGTYTIKESYSDEAGSPQFYADDSAALDLHEVDAPESNDQPFTTQMYENLVSNLTRAAINAYVEQNYDTYGGAVDAVVGQWVSDVAYHRWQGWPYNWSDDTETYIYRMVREHAGEMPEVGDEDQSTTPKRQARVVLQEAVREAGRQQAHAQLISTQDDYDEVVRELGADAVERDDVKLNLSARDASRSVVAAFIDQHSDPVYKRIIEYGHHEPMEFEMYDMEEGEDITREMAFDVLDQDVWAEARSIHREEGTHDPTVRGLAFYEYDQLAEALTEDVLREHNINSNKLLYTTAKERVQAFADAVENHDWQFDFGGLGNDDTTWAAGDVEDIFTSITMHSSKDPQIFNPFARDKERKMASQVLTEDVHERASDALDAMEMADQPAVPADDYLRDELGMDMTFNDIRDDAGVSPEQFIREAIEGVDSEDEEMPLAGWTFVDELVEEAGASVPYTAGPWVLVDYGVVRKHDTVRKLAYFNRDDGSVLRLHGTTTNPPVDGEYGFEESFTIMHIEWSMDGSDDPNYLVRDVNLEYAYEFLRDYIDANAADVRVIETNAGEHYIQESITEDDIDATSFAASIAPSFSIPGPGITVPDALTYGTEVFKQFGGWLRENSGVVDTVSTVAVALFVNELPYLMYRTAPGLNVEPDYHKSYGVGVKATYEFGEQDELDNYAPNDEESKPYTGQIQSNVRITPGAFKFLADGVSPDWLYTAGPDATVLKSMQEQVTQPLQEEADDLYYGPRAVFLGAHVPPTPRGRPSGDVGSYEFEAVDPLEPGEWRDRGRMRELFTRVTRHGYEAANGYRWAGDTSLHNVFEGETGLDEAAVQPWEIQDIGWSLRREYLIGPVEDRLVGYPDEVEAGLESGEGPVLTHRAFLELWDELPDTPESSVLGEVWEFYKARAKDTDDAFTLFDAYDRFRMGIVYDTISERTKFALGATIQQNAADGSLGEIFSQVGQREYWWNVDEEHLSAADVFNPDAGVTELPTWLVFTEGNRPADRVVHTYWDDDAGSYKRTSPSRGEAEVVVGAYDEEYRGERSPYKLATQRDAYNALLKGVRSDIAGEANSSFGGLAVAPEEYDPADPVPEEKRKWIQADAQERSEKVMEGSVDWDELDGTDLSVFGLFLRGIDMETAAEAADHWNLTERFPTRASDVLPANFDPGRADIPSFDEWLDRRRGRNAVGSAASKAKAKATYLREIAEDYSGHVSVLDELGVDEDLPDDIEQMREVQQHYDDSNPYNLDAFYGEEFGESFDDVAHKFNEQRPYDASEMMGSFPELDESETVPEGPNPHEPLDEGDVELNDTVEEPESGDG